MGYCSFLDTPGLLLVVGHSYNLRVAAYPTTFTVLLLSVFNSNWGGLPPGGCRYT